MRWRFDKFKRRFIPGFCAAGVVVLLWWANLLHPLENLAYSALFQVRGERPWDDRIVVVKIDDATLAQLGRFPFRRTEYAKLLQVLTQADSAVVAFDFLWSEPSANPADDRALATAIANQGKVVLPMAWSRQSVLSSAALLPLLPIEPVRSMASAIGHIEKPEQVELDGMTRRAMADLSGQRSLAIATLETYGLMVDGIVLPPLPQRGQKAEDLWINWICRSRQVAHYSFLDVVQGKVPKAQLKDKIVLVGMDAQALDPLVTPFDRLTGGVYLQATLVSNLLNRNLLRPAFPDWLPIALMGAGLGLSGALQWWRTAVQVWSAIALAIGWAVISIAAFTLGNVWLPTATPILLIVVTLAWVVVQERLSLNAVLQDQVQSLWKAYHRDLVAARVTTALVTEQLAQQPVSMQRVTQMATLAEQFGRSHAAQAAIARNLSLGLLAADLDGTVWFCNPVAMQWLRVQVGDDLAAKLIPQWVTLEQWQTVLTQLQMHDDVLNLEVQQATGEELSSDRWFELQFEPLQYRREGGDTDGMDGLLLVLEERTEQKLAAIAQADLNQQLSERTVQLELLNQELEAFSYAVSHDLRAPLRRVKSFSQLLVEDQGDQLDEMGKDYLDRIQNSVQHMGTLIEDLLNLSRIIRSDFRRTPCSLTRLVKEIVEELQQSQPERRAEWVIAPKVVAEADERLLRVALDNLLNNAWKYTGTRSLARIEFGVLEADAEARSGPVFFIRDNGVGFSMMQADKLFMPFQRLQSAAEFAGTGVGLMTTRRIIHRHQGRIWAEAELDRGATFYFTLGGSGKG